MKNWKPKFMSDKKHSNLQAQEWFQELDADSQQDTTISYLRKLSTKDYKNFLAAMELYRQADIVIGKVKDVESKTLDELPTLHKEDNPARPKAEGDDSD